MLTDEQRIELERRVRSQTLDRAASGVPGLFCWRPRGLATTRLQGGLKSVADK